MIVYHGSPRNFKKLRVERRLVIHNTSLENEGCGIYFTTDLNTAKSYGGFIYELEIQDNMVLDFRKLSVCNRYVQSIRRYILSQLGIDIALYIDVNNLARCMQDTRIPIFGTCNEIYLLLDSNEAWYRLPNYKIERVYSILRAYDKKHLKVYMFNYMIKNIGICKTTDESIVRIINKYKI